MSDVIDISSVRLMNDLPSGGPEVREHHKRANEALRHWKKRHHHFDWLLDSDGYISLSHEFVVETRRDGVIDGPIYSLVDERGRRFGDMSVQIWLFLSIVYGAFHLSAWRSHFPTVVEMWIWRACGITLVAGPVLTAVEDILDYFLSGRRSITGKKQHETGANSPENKTTRGWRSFFTYMTGPMLMAVTYPIARVFFLVESFASLRSPPGGTYRTVSWTRFFPHAS